MYLSHNSPYAHNPPFIRPGQSHKIYARSEEIWSQIQILIKFKAGRKKERKREMKREKRRRSSNNDRDENNKRETNEMNKCHIETGFTEQKHIVFCQIIKQTYHFALRMSLVKSANLMSILKHRTRDF